jgi:hypothetical protein
MLLIILIIQLQSQVVLSQKEYCGFDERINTSVKIGHSQLLKIDSVKMLMAFKLAQKNTLSTRSMITIPVVVHVVWRLEEENISDEKILTQIDMLNLVFNNEHEDLAFVPEPFNQVIGNMNLNFCLAAEDPLGNPTSGIIRVQTDQEKIAATDNLFFTETGGSAAWDPT